MTKLLNRRRLVFFSLGAFLLVSFYVFSFIVKGDYLTGFDFDMTHRVQNNVPISFDTYLSYLSLIGDIEIIGIFLVVFLAVRRKIFGLVAITSLFVFAHVVELFGKLFLTHPGPPFMFFRYNLPVTFPSSYVQPGFSYPSGHSLRIIFVAIIVLAVLVYSRLPKNYKVALTIFTTIFTLIMLVSRVSLGEHWTTDVIGGSLLGASFAFFALIFL